MSDMDWMRLLQSIKNTLLDGSLGGPVLLMMMLAMMILPLPTIALDIFFTFNIALAMIVLMVCVYAQRPLDFAAFPTVLLVATLLRLALNVASTRVILLEGHQGGDAAGQVIDAFGAFVIGGNFGVGLVVFTILVIINFVVVTKGAGRVSEVSARFTLDAMPGRQMAIDADLNAGIITQEEAGARRDDVRVEADFYGSMDGASKFVRGDAIAGILILFINIIGGLVIGMVQHDLLLATATEYYVLLTIGDGLVAQIPSLLLSTATAIIVTRTSTNEGMGKEIMGQMFGSPQALGVTAGIIGIIGIIPGMPNLAFLSIAALAGGLAYMIHQRNQVALVETSTATEAAEEAEAEAPAELNWDDVQAVDVLGLEVGYRLIPMVDKNQGGQLLDRIKGVRRKVSQELGFLLQPVHIRDNLDLAPNAYQINLMGVPVGAGDLQPDRELAINPGQVFGELDGIQTKDPTFGLEAVWIDPLQRDHAQTLGYTVVDASTVVATHLSQVMQDHAHELLGHEEVQELLNKLARQAPKLAEDLVPKIVPLVVMVKVLQNLLQESVAITDLRTIAETLAEHGPKSQDPATLSAAVRVSLGRAIVQNIVGSESQVSVMALDPSLEQILTQSVQSSTDGMLGIEPGLAEQLHGSILENSQQLEMEGIVPVLLVTPAIRLLLARLLQNAVPELHVLAYNEIPDERRIQVVRSIGQNSAE
jgi:flagellar biosynthesis protein FlhA